MTGRARLIRRLSSGTPPSGNQRQSHAARVTSLAWLRRAAFVAIVCAGGAAVIGGAAPNAQDRLPSEPGGLSGRSITGAFEGWFEREDGRRSFLVGYYNRNLGTALDIPVGPNNRIEPGGPDLGQPTHFLPGRQVGLFIITVPATFKANQRLTWTITANGETTAIPLHLNSDYIVSPMRDAAVGNTPPSIRFTQAGAPITGPLAAVSTALPQRARANVPMALPVFAADDAKYTSGTNAPPRSVKAPVSIMWSKYRGPGPVTFEPADGKPTLETTSGGRIGEPYTGQATATATFGAPGRYVLHLVANDYSGAGGGGEVCCWTTAMLDVTVE